jgi:hypothetical protein
VRGIRDIIGIVLAGFGILFICVVSWALWGGLASVFLGIILLMLGIFISHMATHKTCPSCYERVKYVADKWKYCGHVFEGVPKSTLREPFYK